MTRQEIKEKYVEFLNSFGLPVPEDKELDKLIERQEVKKEHIYKMTPRRAETIRIYKQTCADFGIKESKSLSEFSEATIWNHILKNTSHAVNEKFGAILNQIENALIKSRVKNVITALYDQRIFIEVDKIPMIVEAAKDDRKIVQAYTALGGDKLLFNEEILNNDFDAEEEDDFEEEEEEEEYEYED